MRSSRMVWRLSFQLALVAGIGSALTGGIAQQLVERAFDARLEDELAARGIEVQAIWQRQVDGVGESLERVENYLRNVESPLLESLLLGDRGRAAVAPRLMGIESLDLLDILDEQGRVITSGSWPERVGFIAEEWADLGTSAAFARYLATPSLSGPVLVGCRELTVGGRSLRLVGGRRIDGRLSDRMAGGGAVALITADGALLATSSRGAALGRDREAAGIDTGTDGPQWVVTSVGLAGGGSARVGVDRASLDVAMRAVVRSMLLMVGCVVLAAALAGLWIARRAAAPVAELVRAVDAIATGREDYTFTRQTEDEFEQLVTAFSRLHRSLELQRERAGAAERVAAWREVARRVAHEVKNPLVPIRLTVQNLLRARVKVPQQFDAMFEEGAATILEEVERLRRLVQEFSEFARLPLPERRPCDLLEVLDEICALWSADADVKLVRRVPERLDPLSIDRDQIARALQNVIGNAVQAMADSAPPRCLEVTVVDEGEWVRIDVADRGPGFDAESRRRLFEPYFTTKTEGTGLGLSITYRVVTEHGGLIHAENRSDGGGRIVIRLPRA